MTFWIGGVAVATFELQNVMRFSRGMEHPRDTCEEIEGIALMDQEKILRSNTAALNEQRPA